MIIDSLAKLAVAIDDVTPDPRNARTGHAIDEIAKSLEKYGQRKPIVVNRLTGHIEAGNGTWKAAKSLGWETIAAVFVEDDPETAIGYGVADNRLTDISSFDEATLAGLFSEIDALEIPGVDEDWLASLNLDGGIPSSGESEGGGDLEDAGPQIDRADELKEEWGVEPGQLWTLGDHRLLCGDATRETDVARVLAGDAPLLMVTDPPYGVEYDPSWRAKAGKNNNKGKMGRVENDDVADWSPAWRLFPGDAAYVYHAGTRSSTVQASLEICGFKIRAQIIWAKENMVLSRGDYHWQHEPCWYAVREGRHSHRTADRTQTTLWTIPTREDSGHGHGTQKPVECMARPIRNHESEMVYDPFAGSGTTIIACENLNRKCRAIEISPAYVAVTLQRWADLTGKTPEKVK